MKTREQLKKEYMCASLLEAPAPLVVRALIDDLLKVHDFLDDLREVKRHPVEEDEIDDLLFKHYL